MGTGERLEAAAMVLGFSFVLATCAAAPMIITVDLLLALVVRRLFHGSYTATQPGVATTYAWR
jgi:hypothetical protein